MFDYPDKSFFDAPEKRVQNTIMMVKASGEPMKTAFPSAVSGAHRIDTGQPFVKKKLDTHFDTHCIKIGVQLSSEKRVVYI